MSRITLKSPIQNKTLLFALLLTLVALAYGMFEVWTEQDRLPEEEKRQLAETSLHEAQQNYKKFEQDFLRQSQEFTGFIVEQLNAQNNELEDAIKEAEEQYDFWGFSIFRNQDLWLWSGFGAYELPASNTVEASIQPLITLERNNNVTFLSFRSTLVMNADTANFHIFTRKKLKQENILPIGDSSELQAQQLFQPPSSYPVRFSFFEPPPAQPLETVTLSTQNSDSVGIAYTLAEDYAEYEEIRENQNFIYRAIFYALIIVFFSLFLISISEELDTWSSLFLKLIAIIIAWLFFANIEYGVGWIQIFGFLDYSDFQSFELLITYCTHSFFIFLISLACYQPVTKGEIKLKDRSSLTLSILYGAYGFVSALLFFFFLTETYSLLTEIPIPVLDLEVFPPLITTIFYVANGIFGLSACLLLIMIGWFLLKFRISTFTSPLLYIITGFALGVYLMYSIQPPALMELWTIFVASILFFIVLVFATLSHLNPTFFNNASRLRLLLLFSYCVVSLSYVAIYKGYSDRLNQQMNQAAQLFISEEASQAEQITQNLLTNLEQSLSESELTQEDLINRPDYIESLFTQQTQQNIDPEWERFSISTQLVNNTGEIIGEYSSNLNSPAWTKAFNMLSLIIPFEAEQIRIQNLRPIIRERPLNEANTNYSSFRRGWIPLYDSENQYRIGWILTSVYRERPQFEKPLRAVIASESSENWSASINITEYINGRSGRTNIVGPPLELPSNLRLPNELVNKVQSDSTLYQVTNLGDLSVREYFIALNEHQIIRAATAHPGLDNHLFSVIRFFFCVLGAGLLLFGLLLWKKDFNIFGQSKRFRDRLIDRFILASLLCLMALMATTYYAINNQTQQSIQDQLLDKINNLTEAITLHESESDDQSAIPLNELTATLDADAALYRNQILETSTTTQIYSQHLLPRLIPWDVYTSIMERGNRQVTRKIILGDQQLLIGYQPWLNEDYEIAGIVAIPTFLDAPKFNEQLLSTTSYLLGLYVIIFGLFILGAALISTQLTSPLEALRDGLRKITGGNLETTLPVKSKDEIGALTNAYNVMVYRLKDLQDELARAEREAAWKEMAQQVAHEIKNPLTPMKLNLQHLERQLKASKEDFSEMRPKIERIANNMIEQIESLSQIASDFSKFAKPTEQEFKEVEVNQLVQSVADLYEPEKKLVVKTKLYQRELWVSGVKDELRRVLINLVKNAFEAMPKRGIVTLTTSLQQQMVIISVEDDGEGIPEDSHDHIFVPNFSTKSSGTGLGLAITKKIVQEHNGEITFTSKVGEGTTFVIRLPQLHR